MADFNVRSDSVNVEQIMEQIRSRIREKRGVDYTEAEIRELAGARLEQFIDPEKLHSNLLAEFHRVRAEGDTPEAFETAVDESVLFETHRGWLRALRSLLRPILKLFLNTKALAALTARSKAELTRKSRDQMTFEVIHNMVVEMTRLSIEVKNLTMRVESMQSRLEFNERRARALESAVVYKPSEPDTLPSRPPMDAPRESRPPAEFRPRHQDHQRHHENQRPQEQQRPAEHQQSTSPSSAPGGSPSGGAPAQGAPDGQRRRRRRRRGRRGGGGQPGQPWAQNQPGAGQPSPTPADATASDAAPSGPSPSEESHFDDGPAGEFDGPDDADGGAGPDHDPQ